MFFFVVVFFLCSSFQVTITGNVCISDKYAVVVADKILVLLLLLESLLITLLVHKKL